MLTRDEQLLGVVRRLSINYEAIFPWMLIPWLEGEQWSERTLRRDLARLAEIGELVRLGQRRGYMLPNVRMAGYVPEAVAGRGRRRDSRIDDLIVSAMQKLHSEYYPVVFPRMLKPWFSEWYRDERSLRRDLSRLADNGRVIRHGQKSGYSLPDVRYGRPIMRRL